MAKSGGGSGNWLMTYADFITLMMIFFIVLYTFTPGVEKNKFTAIIGAFQGNRGVLQYESNFSDEILQIDLQRAKNWEKFYETVMDENLGETVQIELLPDGVKITLGEAALFETFSTALRPESEMILREVVMGLEKYEEENVRIIEIHGHTDNRPVRASGNRKYTSNWELGAGRSISVMNYLRDNSSVDPGQFIITSFAEHRPMAPNNSAENMQKNRRVEVLIRYESVKLEAGNETQ
ncbi:OmpA/MotB family protein [Rhodohalobacter mucosus]|uniref:OmpA-like domain-containing protein n=1 Tax=Rhodohalobacter mucosus TaxID=2079485 RepID=A0A316TSH6_9BACT|nr:flagellar motor protein MotB [Rhodohalobacter mucosus]PWN05182.1 hypothetical protein DDZ15_15775 [Rhodohalobacter mucosus]